MTDDALLDPRESNFLATVYPDTDRIGLAWLMFHAFGPAAPPIAFEHGAMNAIVLAKDLGNMPGNLCTPAYLADQARELGSRDGFDVDILEREDLERTLLPSAAYLPPADETARISHGSSLGSGVARA